MTHTTDFGQGCSGPHDMVGVSPYGYHTILWTGDPGTTLQCGGPKQTCPQPSVVWTYFDHNRLWWESRSF